MAVQGTTQKSSVCCERPARTRLRPRTNASLWYGANWRGTWHATSRQSASELSGVGSRDTEWQSKLTAADMLGCFRRPIAAEIGADDYRTKPNACSVRRLRTIMQL